MKLKKIRAGLYATEDGLWEIERDVTGYVTIEQREGTGPACGLDDDGWSLSSGGNVYDWFDTKREAVAALERIIEGARA